MAYEKQTWVNGDVITDEKLNHIEDGIANAGESILNCKATETEVLFDDTITSNAVENQDYGRCTITASSSSLPQYALIEYDGESYLVEHINNSSYGAKRLTSKYDFSNYPFAISTFDKPTLTVITSSVGEHTLKFTAVTLDVFAKPCLKNAVESLLNTPSATGLSNNMVMASSYNKWVATDYPTAKIKKLGEIEIQCTANDYLAQVVISFEANTEFANNLTSLFANNRIINFFADKPSQYGANHDNDLFLINTTVNIGQNAFRDPFVLWGETQRYQDISAQIDGIYFTFMRNSKYASDFAQDKTAKRSIYVMYIPRGKE